MSYVQGCSLCKVKNVKEAPEFGLCPNCLKDIKVLLATMLKLSDGGKKTVDREDLFVQAQRERLRSK